MQTNELVDRIARHRPDLEPADLLRLALLVVVGDDNGGGGGDWHRGEDESLRQACDQASFRLDAIVDQYEAVGAEVHAVCSAGPMQFSPDQLWTLLRAVKVQSQMIDLFCDVTAIA